MRKYILLTAVIGSLLLAGCQTSDQENNQNNTDNKPPVVEEIVPVLKTQNGEFKLRSQTSRFLDADKSSVEIILSNTYSAFCAKQDPQLKNDEQQIKITIKSKDKTALTKGEMVNNANVEIDLSKKTKDSETKLDSKLISSLNISDLNTAVIRGNIKSGASNDGKVESLDGEFFTAICK